MVSAQQLPLFENIPAIVDAHQLHDEVNARFNQVHLQHQQTQLQLDQLQQGVAHQQHVLAGQLQGIIEQQQGIMAQQQVLAEQQLEAIQKQQELLVAVQALEAHADLQPMRTFNMAASTKGPLKGPDGFIPPNLPNMRNELRTATGNQCIHLWQHLGLGALPHNIPVNIRRERLAPYLGVVL
ncbi:hypothetical protein J3R82DRAFT_11218 [Butyriboletus roseoflavus]|nr:hypothetical protein J3R82DRAFT_11218 [Butyriboletus roseoflavus]